VKLAIVKVDAEALHRALDLPLDVYLDSLTYNFQTDQYTVTLHGSGLPVPDVRDESAATPTPELLLIVETVHGFGGARVTRFKEFQPVSPPQES